MPRALRLIVSGRVQGVGFRAFVADAARAECLSGWVRNLADGTVEVQVAGEAKSVGRFEWQLWQGPAGARVDDVRSHEVAPAPDTEFTIRGDAAPAEPHST